MKPQEVFPATTWALKKLTSRFAQRLYLSVFAVLLIPGILLRVETALFARKAAKMVSALSSLQVGKTSRSEALSRLPQLKPLTAARGDVECGFDECLWTGIPPAGFSYNVLSTAGGTGNRALYRTLNLWGFRALGLDINVNIRAGKVAHFGYHLMVSAPELDRELVVGVSLQDLIPSTFVNQTNPTYGLRPARRDPSGSIGVLLTPAAPQEVWENAFDVKLGCLSSLFGCETWYQLLPGIKYHSCLRSTER